MPEVLDGTYSYDNQNVRFNVFVDETRGSTFLFQLDNTPDHTAKKKFIELMQTQFNNHGRAYLVQDNSVGYIINIPKADYDYFKEHVLDNQSTTKWTTYVGRATVTGTWKSKKAKAIEDDQLRAKLEESIRGTVRNEGGKSKHSHRKPTKRRRNRRRNRKTKKN